MKIALKTIKAILIIILTLVVIGIAIIKTFSSTILSEQYVFKMLHTSNYYNNLYEELKNNFENYIGPSGLDENILDNICTVQDIEKDTETILGNIYEGTNKKVDTDEIKQRVIENIYKAIEKSESNIIQANIDKFADTISDEYINTISHTKYEEKINDTYKKIMKVSEIGNKILFTAIIVLLILLIILNLKNIYLAVSNIGIVGIASGAFFTISYYIINSRVNIQHVKVLNNPISTLLQKIVIDILNTFMHIGIIMAVIGIICIIIGNLIKIKNTEE